MPNRPLTLTELSATPLVLCTTRVLRDETDGLLKKLKEKLLQPNVVMHCSTPEALKAAVKTGVGIGFLYRDAVEPELSRGEMILARLPELKLRVDTVIVYCKDKPLSGHGREFLALLDDEPVGEQRRDPFI